jgi:competence protein ComEC
MKQPIIPLLVAISLGIIAGNTYQLSTLPLVLALTSVLTVLLFAAISQFKTLIATFVIITSFTYGFLIIQVYDHERRGTNHIANQIPGEHVTIEGMICETPHVFPDRTDLSVATRVLSNGNESVPVEGPLLLSVRNSHQYKYGDFVRFKTKLRSIRNFNNPGGFDYKKHMSYRGIFVRGHVKDASGIIVLRTNQGSALKSYLEQIRSNLRRIIQDNTLSPEKEIIQAMILGEQQAIPKDIMEKFNKTGTTHILAISGFNIGIVAFFSIFAIRALMKSIPYLLLRFNMITLSTIIAVFPVMMYAMIAGMGISVIRATIMAIAFMVALVWGKENDLYNTLALAALIILVFSPHSLFDVSFQLSFTAVWAILFITPKIMKIITNRSSQQTSSHAIFTQKTAVYVITFIVATASATLGTLPLIVYYFNRVSMVVLVSNFFVTPLLGIITIPICVAIIFAAFLIPSLAVILVNIASFLVWLSVVMVDFFASVPGSSFFMFTPTLIEIALCYIILVLCIDLLDRFQERKEKDTGRSMGKKYLWHQVILAFLVIVLISQGIIQFAHNTHRKDVRVTFVDVGQGNSSFIQFPGGKTMLIDGGGFHLSDFDVGRNVVAPFLWHKRVNTVDVVVLTHPHPDHLNGLLFILQNFNVKEVWTNGQISSMESYRNFMNIITDKQILHRRVSKDTGRVNIGGAELQILNPEKSIESSDVPEENYQDTNNNAIVMKVTYGKVSFLFPSDISEKGEARILATGRTLNSQVLLVPHHGGFTSSSIPFIKGVQPEIAVISCGADNIHDLPNAHVLERYKKFGAAVYRTDVNGAICITTDGHHITTRVFNSGGM